MANLGGTDYGGTYWVGKVTRPDGSQYHVRAYFQWDGKAESQIRSENDLEWPRQERPDLVTSWRWEQNGRHVKFGVRSFGWLEHWIGEVEGGNIRADSVLYPFGWQCQISLLLTPEWWRLTYCYGKK